MKLRYWFALLALGLSFAAMHLWSSRPDRAVRLRRARSSFARFPERMAVPGGEASRAARQQRSRGEAKKGKAPSHWVEARHQPLQPKSGEPVTITIDFKGDTPPPASGLALEYQLVDPGKYIALADAAYARNWAAVSLMVDPGSARRFRAILPGNLQKHRRLVRYRVRNSQGQLAPSPDDPEKNYAYFVYDGLPAWKAAINPRSADPKLRTPVTYSSEVLQRVPIYQFISSRAAVEGATWKDSDQFGGQGRNAYYYTGTMVYDGAVYDHIGFRARGGSWRHAMGKNMWKFNFLPGHRFAARDDYGQPYPTKWDKLNLGACIQQGDYGMRGEQGMFEAVGFRLFNLAGTEAPATHWVHFRIIDQADEAPTDQYAGDFWGLYLAVENVDEHFLKAHHLPSGNLYKMEFGAKTEFNGDLSVTDQRDIREFVSAISRQAQPDSWWAANVDLERYDNYRAVLEGIHHYDVDGGKNYFFYLDPESRKWIVIPWDIDLTWGDHMFGGGYEPFFRSGILSRAPAKTQYQERVAELRDLLFNPDQLDQLIDEHAALISDSAGGPSLVDADRAKWDYNPIMDSRYVMSMKAGQGRFYFGNPHGSFRDMVDYMKKYAARRVQWMDARLLSDYRPAPTPKISRDGSSTTGKPALSFKIDSAAPVTAKCEWRLAEVTDPNQPSFDPHQPWKYEIQSLWKQEGQPSVTVPAQLLAAGHTYRVRARWVGLADGSSRWSTPIQFVAERP